MDDIILKADNLYFTYDGNRTPSLSGLSLAVRRGSRVALMGPNGSGKSTFFLCCNGIHRPDSGTILFDGQPVSYTKKGLLNLRRNVGIVFQDPDSQLFSASVFQEISFGVMNLGASEKEARLAVEKVMEEMDITACKDKPVHALSGGQKKLVSIADILVMNPRLVILDEPTAALDPGHEALVTAAIDRMSQKGITVMTATHDVDYAFQWADQVVILKDGKLLREGTPEDVFSDVEILRMANLRQPAPLTLFRRLCQKGILDPSLPVPKSLDELEQYL